MAWYNSDWQYRKPITIDSAQVPGDLVNFPVLVSVTDADLAHTSAGGHVAESDGSDILFTAGDGSTLLPHQLEKYEHSTGELVAWVKTDVSSSVDTEIYVYYGNAYVHDGEQQDSVWDANYLAAWHMNQDSDNHAAIQNTATYHMTPLIVRTDPDAFLVIFRTGTDHAGNDGIIAKMTYDPTTYTWGSSSAVYNDASYDSRNPGGGYVESDLFVFFARYDDDTTTWIDAGYIKSTDDGATWGSYTPVTIDAALTSFSPYGAVVNVDGVYYQPYYGDDGAGTYKIKLLKSTNQGATWTDDATIYSGATNYNECSVAYLGDGDLMALARNEAGGVLRQFQSTDSGANWSNTGDTNLGTAGDVTIPWLTAEGDRIIAYYCARADDNLRVSEGFKSTVFGFPTAWAYNFIVATGLTGASGYPTALRWKPERYVLVYADEASASDSDLYAQIYPERVLDSTDSLITARFLGGTPPVPGTGQVDGGVEFSGANYCLTGITTSTLNFIQNTGIFTIEAWMKLDNYTAAALQIVAGNTASSAEKGFFFGYENRGGIGTQQLRIALYKGASGTPIIDSFSSASIIGDNLLHHIAVTGDGTNVAFYVDGASDAGSGTMGTKSSGASNREMGIGAYNYSTIGGYLDGILDEIRISDIDRGSNWVGASFNNQSSPGTFYAVGTEETEGPPASYQPRHGVAMLGGVAMV